MRAGRSERTFLNVSVAGVADSRITAGIRVACDSEIASFSAPGAVPEIDPGYIPPCCLATVASPCVKAYWRRLRRSSGAYIKSHSEELRTLGGWTGSGTLPQVRRAFPSFMP